MMARYTDEQLERIFNKYCGKCFFCSCRLKFAAYGNRRHSKGWEVDHGNPSSKGGKHDARNWKLACWRCNSQKGNKTSTEYRTYLKKQNAQTEELNAGEIIGAAVAVGGGLLFAGWLANTLITSRNSTQLSPPNS